MSESPKHNEWWICCWTEDRDRAASPDEIPEGVRFVAYYQDLGGDGGSWNSISADPSPSNWFFPIKKVSLA
jgi:hypothetical protein